MTYGNPLTFSVVADKTGVNKTYCGESNKKTWKKFVR